MLWSPNCQLLYPFENQANDYSGNARHGTVFGSGVYATKPNGGRCLYFDGVGDYVATPSFGLSGTVVVFAAFIRSRLVSATQGIYQQGAISATVGHLLLYRRNSNYDLAYRYANGASPEFITASNFFLACDDQWVSLLVVGNYTGKKCYFYRGGLPFYTGSFSGTPVFPSAASATTGLADGAPLVGYLANVQLWTLPTCPPDGVLTANANRLMLGMNPIW